MKEEPFPPVNVSDGGILVKSPKLSFVHAFTHVVSSLEKVDFVAIVQERKKEYQFRSKQGSANASIVCTPPIAQVSRTAGRSQQS